MDATPPPPDLPRRCDLQAYVQSFLEDADKEEAAVIAKKPPSRRRGCWLDRGKEAAFLHQAVAKYERVLPLLQEAPVGSAEATSIPKVLHHIWLGSPFPSRFQAFRASWLEHHPEKDGVF